MGHPSLANGSMRNILHRSKPCKEIIKMCCVFKDCLKGSDKGVCEILLGLRRRSQKTAVPRRCWKNIIPMAEKMVSNCIIETTKKVQTVDLL
jgi:hypothetical protein